MAACASCKAPITWTLTENGKRMPIDAEPVAEGNIEIVGETRRHLADGGTETTPVIRVLKKGEGDTLPGLSAPSRYVSHFATCPDAGKFRKGAK